jgi:Ala-tRNA(Pro) deacylase
MSIAAALQKHFSRKHIAYDVVPHAPTEASVSTGQACRVPPDRLSRCYRRRAGSIGQSSRRNPARPSPLASENEIEQLFEDCAPGAIPPIGECYGLDAVVEPRICDQPDVYFVGGDHATLVRVSQTQFAALTKRPYARFAAGG